MAPSKLYAKPAGYGEYQKEKIILFKKAFAGLVMDDEAFHESGARLSFRVPAEKAEEIGRLIVDLTSGRAEIGN